MKNRVRWWKEMCVVIENCMGEGYWKTGCGYWKVGVVKENGVVIGKWVWLVWESGYGYGKVGVVMKMVWSLKHVVLSNSYIKVGVVI